MTSAAVIRPLDRETLVSCVEQFVDVARDVPGEYWSAENFLRDLPDKWALSQAAWDGERPVGYAIISRKPGAAPHLHHFMVIAEQRGSGLGARLLSAVVARCREHGCFSMTLRVADSNVDAQRFYIRHEFIDDGIDRGYRNMRRDLTVTKVAIHQPNYAPWLGYFAKMAQADVFVFLDDAQYSKNGYINRVQIDGAGSPRWLTVPVSYEFGDPINRVKMSGDNWRAAHLDTLKTYYASSPYFSDIHQWFGDTMNAVGHDNLADGNEALIRALAARLGARCSFHRSSEIRIAPSMGDDRLIAILKSFGSGVSYVSGKGGSQYQDPAKFEREGIRLTYSGFEHPTYDQGHDFLLGLSVLDALFRTGWERTAIMIREAARA